MTSFNMYPDIECCVFLYMYHRNVSGLYDILICKLKTRSLNKKMCRKNRLIQLAYPWYT